MTEIDQNKIMIPAWVAGQLQPVEKLAAHKQGLRHKAVSVFVVTNDKVLIQQRALGKYHTPGLWANTCCTHPAWDEASLDCANRRLKEELGISGLSPEFRGQVEYRADVGGGLVEHECVDLFLARTSGNLDINPNPNEVMATRWIAFDDLRAEVATNPDRFTPWLRIYLKDHQFAIFGHQD